MNDKGFASFVKTLSVLQLAALRHDAAKFDDVEALRVIDAEMKSRAPKVWERLKCEACGREFESENANAYTCPKCDRIQAEAQAQTATMPAPDLTVRPWSRAAMRERLGVTGDVDE